MKKIFNKFGNKVRVDSIPAGECFMTVFDGSVFMMSNRNEFSATAGEEKLTVMNLTTGSINYFKKDEFVMPVDIEIIIDKRGKDND